MSAPTDRGPGEILVVSRSEVEALLTPAACLQRCLDTFAWVGAGQVDQTNPVNLWVHDRTAPGPEPPFGYGVVQAFPAMIRPLERAAVKWLSSYSKNPRRSLPAISALDLVTDTDTGMPLALVDGTSVTNMRTGGHAAVGAKFLARPDSRRVAIIGCGNEGRTHLWLLAELFDLAHVAAFDIDDIAAARFATEATERLAWIHRFGWLVGVGWWWWGSGGGWGTLFGRRCARRRRWWVCVGRCGRVRGVSGRAGAAGGPLVSGSPVGVR